MSTSNNDLERIARVVEASGFEWAADVAEDLRELRNRRDAQRSVVFEAHVPRSSLSRRGGEIRIIVDDV